MTGLFTSADASDVSLGHGLTSLDMPYRIDSEKTLDVIVTFIDLVNGDVALQKHTQRIGD